MHHKKILIGVGICLFIISAALGYYWPDLKTWKEERARQKLAASFVLPSVPKRLVEDFALHFNQLQVATERQTLPDDPFQSTTGPDKRLSDFAGKPTLVNFWARWCSPCVVELPSLQRLKEHYEGRMNVIAIALEENKSFTDIADFLKKRGIADFAGNIDATGAISRNLSMRGIPTSFLIGSDGVILYRFEGDADWTSAESKAFFDVFLLQNK